MQGYRQIGALLADASGAPSPTIFAMLGGTNVPWLAAALADDRLRLVKTRHEATAVAAAAAYGRVSGTIGLCTVTRGPGFANAINALLCAVRTHAPLLLIVGESPSSEARTGQNIEQAAFTALIGAGFHHASAAADLPRVVTEAAVRARHDGRPQVLSLGDAVLGGDIGSNATESSIPVRASEDGPDPDPSDVERVIELVDRARQPLIVAGQGAVLSDAGPELRSLSDRSGARLATTLQGLHLFDGHPADVGLCGGWASAAGRASIRGSDLVLAFGASLNEFTLDHGDLLPGATVVQVDTDPDAFGRTVAADLAIVGDAAVVARSIASTWDAHGRPARRAPVGVPTPGDRAASVLSVDLGASSERGIDPRSVYRSLEARLPRDRMIATDSGRFLSVGLSLLSAPTARSFVLGRGYGSVGLGIGTALGASAAAPDRTTVLITGDGGFLMAAQDLDAFRLSDLAVTIVVFNDRQYGAEVRQLRRFGLAAEVARQDTPDLVGLARAHGGDGVVVDTVDALDDVALDRRGLFVLDVRIDPEVDGLEALGRQAESRLAARPS